MYLDDDQTLLCALCVNYMVSSSKSVENIHKFISKKASFLTSLYRLQSRSYIYYGTPTPEGMRIVSFKFLFSAPTFSSYADALYLRNKFEAEGLTLLYEFADNAIKCYENEHKNELTGTNTIS